MHSGCIWRILFVWAIQVVVEGHSFDVTFRLWLKNTLWTWPSCCGWRRPLDEIFMLSMKGTLWTWSSGYGWRRLFVHHLQALVEGDSLDMTFWLWFKEIIWTLSCYGWRRLFGRDLQAVVEGDSLDVTFRLCLKQTLWTWLSGCGLTRVLCRIQTLLACKMQLLKFIFKNISVCERSFELLKWSEMEWNGVKWSEMECKKHSMLMRTF